MCRSRRMYCSTEWVCKGVSIHIAQLNSFVRVSIPVACNKKIKVRVIQERQTTYCGGIGCSIHVGPVRNVVGGQNI